MEISSGLSALENLANGPSESQENKFTSFKSGDSRKVRVISLGDVKDVYTYSIFKVVNTFTPKNLPKISKNGYPVEDYTPFDLAWKYHQDRTEEFGDDDSKKASMFRLKQRFAFGFYDLDEQKEIVIDFSKNQALALYTALKKQENKLDKRAFELEKMGSGTNTTVSITPEPLDDLTDEQKKAYDNAPKEFDKSLFEGLYFEQDEEQMKASLVQAGFDLSHIGLEPPKNDSQADTNSAAQSSDENPFEAANADDPTQQF